MKIYITAKAVLNVQHKVKYIHLIVKHTMNQKKTIFAKKF